MMAGPASRVFTQRFVDDFQAKGRILPKDAVDLFLLMLLLADEETGSFSGRDMDLANALLDQGTVGYDLLSDGGARVWYRRGSPG